MILHKALKIIALILALIGVVFAVMIIAGNVGMVSALLLVSYAVLAVILVLVLIYVLKGLFSGDIKKTLISVGLFLGIFAIAYVVSGGDTNVYEYNNLPATEAESHMVGMGLIAFYIFALAAIGSMLFAGARKLTR